MAMQYPPSDVSAHTPGTHRGEDWVKDEVEPGRKGQTATARSSTSINPEAAGPIDPRMPNLPPA